MCLTSTAPGRTPWPLLSSSTMTETWRCSDGALMTWAVSCAVIKLPTTMALSTRR